MPRSTAGYDIERAALTLPPEVSMESDAVKELAVVPPKPFAIDVRRLCLRYSIALAYPRTTWQV